MCLTRAGVAVVAAIALTGCQSINGMRINGVDIHPAQGETFCERNIAMCLLGGAAVAGGVALAAMGHSYHSSSGIMGAGAGY